MPIPKAVMQLAIPTVISSLVMVIYNLADTYFVGMLNDPIQNAAVTLAAPVLLAFNAINNLFGVGSSSMMSRALGSKDMDTVYKSSAFGFYCALFSGLLFSVLYTVFSAPLLVVLGANAETAQATGGYLMWTVSFGAAPAILNVVMAYLVRAEVATPPAFAALPGPKRMPAFRNTSVPSSVVGMLAPSATACTPFWTSIFASSSLSSFCVAQGSAMSHLMLQTPLPSWYSLFGRYAL